MSGTILENLSGRKLSVLVTILCLSQLTCFLVGLISPSPASTMAILSTVCVDNNPEADSLHRWFTRKCPQQIHLSQEQSTLGLDAKKLVFVVEMPLFDNDFSRWQQNLVGVLQIDMVYKTGQKLINMMIELTLDARLAYSDKTHNGKTPWTYYRHAETKRFMDCTFDDDVQHKEGYPYNCTMVPLFELGSLYHDYYLLNLRLPINTVKEINTQLGKVDDIYLHTIHMNGGFTKVWLLRVQSPEGTKRVEITPSSTTSDLFELIHDAFDLDSFEFALYKQKNKKEEISSSKTRTVRNMGLKHGDMIYLAPVNGNQLFNCTSSGEPVSEPGPSTSNSFSWQSSTSTSNKARNVASFPKSNIKEDEVDQILYKLDGRIERKRDDKLCRHNANSKCVHCSSLEPFDDSYLKEQNIKHLSFHSYLRKMMSGVDRGKFLALEDISCGIKSGCKDHPPWPKGICSKCQPNAITLNMQAYRHVDNVAFENTNLVEKFLNYWRSSGHQRLGFLYGSYEVHNDVPLGIRANVVAIYEPPQESTRDSIRLLPDEKEAVVNQIANSLGIRRVGWIFTDLVPDDIQKGTVKHTRNVNSHFLSAQECIMAGYFQNLHPNSCKFASSGSFGSKFVTVCVTGDKLNQVHMEGYQVSNQCMALVRDNCLVPTKDASELGYVRESTDKQYVPDVYYKEKDSYGNEVSRLARPLPVEYLLVDVPASTPVTPTFTFNPDPSKQPFPVENRFVDGHIQDFNALATYLQQFAADEFYEAIADFHLLIYIATMDMLPMRDYLDPLLNAIKGKNRSAAKEWSRSEQWATLEQLIAASSPPPSRPGSVASGSIGNSTGHRAGPKWPCPYCTFINESEAQTCAMCNLPRSSS